MQEIHISMQEDREDRGRQGKTVTGIIPNIQDYLRPTLFPGSSLFLPQESTLVAAGHVSARFLQIQEK